jgi:hypothetical protein
MLSHQGAVSTPWEGLKSPKILNQAAPQRIQVDVAHQLQEVRVVLANNRLESVMEQMPDPAVTPVEVNGVRRHQTPHECREGRPIGADEQVKMVGHQAPCEATGARFKQKFPESLKEEFVVFGVEEDPVAFVSACDYMMEESGCGQSRLSGHEWSLAGTAWQRK